jgi:hypothetical protein
VRSHPAPSLVLCAPLLVCALKLHGGFIRSPAGMMQEITRTCSVLRVAAARRSGRSQGPRHLPARLGIGRVVLTLR